MSVKMWLRVLLVTCLGTPLVAVGQNCASPPVAEADVQGWPGETRVIEVLANDYDPAGRPLSVLSVSSGTGGTVTKTADSQGILFIPASGAASASFNYVVQNSDGQTASATVTLTDDPFTSGPQPTLDFDWNCNRNRWCSFTSRPVRHDGIRARGWRFFQNSQEIVSCRKDNWSSDKYLCLFPNPGTVRVQHTLFYYDGFVDTNGAGKDITVVDNYETNWTVGREGMIGVSDGLEVNVYVTTSTDTTTTAALTINWGDGEETPATNHWSGSYDGQTSYHTYKNPGPYRITMYRRRTNTTTKESLGSYDIEVVNQSPQVTLTAANGTFGNEVVEITWSVVDEHPPYIADAWVGMMLNPLGPVKYEWDYGDGQSEIMVPSETFVTPLIRRHTYPSKRANYVARLKVTDYHGGVAEGSVNVNVTDSRPVAAMALNCQGRDCVLDASASAGDAPVTRYYFSAERLGASPYWISADILSPVWKFTLPDASGKWRAHLGVRDDTQDSAIIDRDFSPREALPGTAFYAVDPCSLGSTVITADQWGGLLVRGKCGVPNDPNVLYAAVNVRLSGAGYPGSLRIEQDYATAILNINPARPDQSAFAVIPLNDAGQAQVLAKLFGPANATATLKMDIMGYFGRITTVALSTALPAVGPLWYRPVPPCVLFDTRTEGPGLTSASPRTFDMRNRCAFDGRESAVALQASLITPTTSGTAVAYAADSPLPSGPAFIEAAAGRNLATALFTKLTDGQMKIATNMSSANATLSTAGVFSADPGLRFHATRPCRLLDTRVDRNGKPKAPIKSGEVLAFQMRGDCGVSSYAKAVLASVVIINADTSGHLKLFAAGSDASQYAAVNYLAAETMGSTMVVPLGSGAEDVAALLASNGVGKADLVIDTYGYFEERKNVAAAANGGAAAVSSTLSSAYPAAALIDGDRRGVNWGAGGGWHDGGESADVFPDFVEIAFDGEKLIDEVDLFTLQDNPEAPKDPTTADRFTRWGVTNYSIGYWDRATGQWVYPIVVDGNDRVWSRGRFSPPVRTKKLSIVSRGALEHHSRLVEIEAFEVPDSGRKNVAAAVNGGQAFASSVADPVKFPASAVIDGDRRGLNWTNGGGWHDATFNAFPDHLQVKFDGPKLIDTIDIYTLQDDEFSPVEPTQSTTFTQEGLADFNVLVRDPSSGTWTQVASVVNNDKVWKRITLPAPVSADMVWISISRGLNYHSRMVELEVWEVPPVGSAPAAVSPEEQ